MCFQELLKLELGLCFTRRTAVLLSFSFVWVASQDTEAPAPKVEEAGWASSETSNVFLRSR